MPDWLHIGLVNHLQVSMKPDECQGDQRTVAFVRDGLAWVAEHGAHCDCEVVFHRHPTLDDDSSTVH